MAKRYPTSSSERTSRPTTTFMTVRETEAYLLARETLRRIKRWSAFASCASAKIEAARK